MAIKDYHELILYWHDLQIASNNGYYNWWDGSIQDTNLSWKTQLEVKEMIWNFSTKLINYHLEHNPSFKANYDVEVQKYVAEWGLLEDIELWVKEWLVEWTKDYFVAYYEAYESLKNIEYKDIQNWVKKIWWFVSNPIDSIASTYEYAKTFTSELYEKILVLTWYEASKWISYVWTTLWLSSADPAAKLIQLAWWWLFVKMWGKVDELGSFKRVTNAGSKVEGKIEHIMKPEFETNDLTWITTYKWLHSLNELDTSSFVRNVDSAKFSDIVNKPYVAEISIKDGNGWIIKKWNNWWLSSVFPDIWDRNKIMEEVKHAIENNKGRELNTDSKNEYKWFSKDGTIQINFYLNNKGEILSYFPKIND